MTAATDSLTPASLPQAQSGPKTLDSILAGTALVPANEAPATALNLPDHPLEGADTVEAAQEVIANLLVEERKTGKRRVYPRRLLRQQHIIAFMLANPFATTTEVCAFFGIAPGTLSTIAKSDTFKAMVDAHKVALTQDVLSDINEALRVTLAAGIEKVQKAVVERDDPDYALAVVDKVSNRLGMGAKHQGGTQVNVNVVTPAMIEQARNRARRLPNAS